LQAPFQAPSQATSRS